MCEGFNIRFKNEYRMHVDQMKVMRWVGTLIYNVNAKKGAQREPEKLLTLPELEEEKKVAKIDMDEIRRIKEEWTPPIYEKGKNKDTKEWLKLVR